MKNIKNSDIKPTVGLEVHVELNTKSKMFCGCVNKHFKVKPNTHTCPVCLGLPGALPVPNRKAIDWTILIGLGLNCKINLSSKFDRKHYFYPDLPKGYQISQYQNPFCHSGFIHLKGNKIRIARVHLEEDTGKLIHKNIAGKNVTLVDFNRSGVPLVEIVTEPDIISGAQAKQAAQMIQNLIRHMDVSDCDMEKGSLRLEANVSWGLGFDYKVEIKNLNSFKFLEKAVSYELARQKDLLDEGTKPTQETRGWHENQEKTVVQRIKETSADYRYFPEPDIPPIKFTKSKISRLRDKLPDDPGAISEMLKKKYNISNQYIKVLLSDKQYLDYAIKALKIGKKKKIEYNKIAGAIVNKEISIKNTKPRKLIQNLINTQKQKISDKKSLEQMASDAIKKNPKAVKDYKNGKIQAISAIIGYIMKKSQGKADAQLVKSIIKKKLKKTNQ